jgi:hypothetical protein
MRENEGQQQIPNTAGMNRLLSLIIILLPFSLIILILAITHCHYYAAINTDTHITPHITHYAIIATGHYIAFSLLPH